MAYQKKLKLEVRRELIEEEPSKEPTLQEQLLSHCVKINGSWRYQVDVKQTGEAFDKKKKQKRKKKRGGGPDRGAIREELEAAGADDKFRRSARGGFRGAQLRSGQRVRDDRGFKARRVARRRAVPPGLRAVHPPRGRGRPIFEGGPHEDHGQGGLRLGHALAAREARRPRGAARQEAEKGPGGPGGRGDARRGRGGAEEDGPGHAPRPAGRQARPVAVAAGQADPDAPARGQGHLLLQEARALHRHRQGRVAGRGLLHGHRRRHGRQGHPRGALRPGTSRRGLERRVAAHGGGAHGARGGAPRGEDGPGGAPRRLCERVQHQLNTFRVFLDGHLRPLTHAHKLLYENTYFGLDKPLSLVDLYFYRDVTKYFYSIALSLILVVALFYLWGIHDYTDPKFTNRWLDLHIEHWWTRGIPLSILYVAVIGGVLVVGPAGIMKYSYGRSGSDKQANAILVCGGSLAAYLWIAYVVLTSCWRKYFRSKVKHSKAFVFCALFYCYMPTCLYVVGGVIPVYSIEVWDRAGKG